MGVRYDVFTLPINVRSLPSSVLALTRYLTPLAVMDFDVRCTPVRCAPIGSV